jgi:hypothetical protein
MPKFTDAAGCEWSLAITLNGLEALRELDPKFLLGEPSDTLQRLENDYVLLCQAAWVLCQPQAAARQIDQFKFYDQLHGDCLGTLAEALLQAIVDFTPAHQRALLKAGLEKNRVMRELLTAKAMAKINDPVLADRLVKAAEEVMDHELGNLTTRFRSAGNSRASSASSPVG